MEYNTLEWLSDFSKNRKNGDTYAHVSYKHVKDGKTVEEYEKSYINGEPVKEKKKQCLCGKSYDNTLVTENRELKEKVYDLEEENKSLKDENKKLRAENEKLEEGLKKKESALEDIKKAPICGGFMVSDEDMKNGNIEDMFRKAAEYMQSVLNSRCGK
jgi:predicted nuclease with TOPRIM domain